MPESVAGLSLAAASGGVIAAAAVADADEPEAKDEAQPVLPLFMEEERREREEDEVQVAEWPEQPRVDEPIMPFPPRTTPAPAPLREEDETDMKVPDFLLAERDRDTDEEPRVTGRGRHLRTAISRRSASPSRGTSTSMIVG